MAHPPHSRPQARKSIHNGPRYCAIPWARLASHVDAGVTNSRAVGLTTPCRPSLLWPWSACRSGYRRQQHLQIQVPPAAARRDCQRACDQGPRRGYRAARRRSPRCHLSEGMDFTQYTPISSGDDQLGVLKAKSRSGAVGVNVNVSRYEFENDGLIRTLRANTIQPQQPGALGKLRD